MIIVYESKTGFTKRYADMLAEKTGLKAYRTNEIPEDVKDEEMIFLGWMKAGRIQGLNKVRKNRLAAVCATGTARNVEPSEEAVIERNRINGIPFFIFAADVCP
jgi:hypothetical protein